jgi:protein tyrosine phosphatase
MTNAERLLVVLADLQEEADEECTMYWKAEDAERCRLQYRTRMLELIEDAFKEERAYDGR